MRLIFHPTPTLIDLFQLVPVGKWTHYGLNYKQSKQLNFQRQLMSLDIAFYSNLTNIIIITKILTIYCIKTKKIKNKIELKTGS